MNITLNIPSPIQPLNDPLFEQFGLDVWIKRDDLIHPVISGNKWRKLKYIVKDFQLSGKQQWLTFGGAYSNHIYATAAMGLALGVSTIGVIRGERTLPLNATLAYAESAGMRLVYVDRGTYRNRDSVEMLSALREQYDDPFVVPEGGSCAAGARGCADIWQELPFTPNYMLTAVGTGCTLAGLLNSAPSATRCLGVPVLKGGEFLRGDIEHLLGALGSNPVTQWQLSLEYHFGGYAKSTDELERFVAHFVNNHGIPIEPVYTGKLFYAFYDLVKQAYFPRGSRIVLLHTGGLRESAKSLGDASV